MIKLLIVDDEKFIRMGLVNTIDWAKWGIEIIGEADNGRIAIEKIQKFKPEILIADIKMPIMDGIELAKYISDNNLDIKVILLSGYDEFDYAQKAIKYGVVEYLLKPIGEEKLFESISRVKLMIEKDKKINNEIEKNQKMLNESIPIIKENYVKSLLYGKNVYENLKNKFELLDINLNTNDFFVIIISFFSYNYEKNITDIKLNIKKIFFNYKCEIINIFGNSIAIVANKPCYFHKDELYNQLDKDLSKIVIVLRTLFNLETYICIGNVYEDFNGIKKSFNECLELLRYVQSINDKKILYAKDVNIKKIDLKKIDFKEYSDFEIMLRTGELNNVFSILNKTIGCIRTDNILEINAFKRFCIELLIRADNVAMEFCKDDINENYIFNFSSYAELIKINNLVEIAEYIKICLIKINDLISNKKKNSYNNRIIKKSVEYIKENYNKDITVQAVSKEIGITPNYFSHIFNQELGKSFTDFLNEYRIEMAKEYLYKEKYKIYEVAYLVGFSQYRYFIQIFKKYTGCTPTEYLNILSRH